MSPERKPRWPEIRRLVGELSELPLAEREAALAGTDSEIAAEVRELLAVDDEGLSLRMEGAVGRRAAEWLGEQVAGEPLGPSEAGDSGLAGEVLGAWRLEHPLGRGGMAEVWKASRSDGQYEQSVAVKLLKRGMDSEELVARFHREKQILARLAHPAIARLLDGGVAPDGRPFLVLEKVAGEPVTTWCARTAASLETRVRLLIEVASAVSAAHRQLVVHRDLKPSNILVGPDGRAKLLDFGIAKLLDGDESPLQSTRSDVRLLTPAYAAPEQIRGEPVSTATDVYALGVVAYELLTGSLPHRRTGRAVGNLAAGLATETVERPSALVGRLANDEVDPAASQRLRRTARSLAGDLDQIVLTALRTEPNRRYPSIDAMAEDLENFLAGRPVSARRDSVGYRLRKFAGRHRIAVVTGLVALVALVAALALALGQARRAEAAARHAEHQAARAERVRAFLASVFAVSDPVRARGETVTARALLDEGLKRVDAELAAEPDLRAEMLDLLAGLYRKLGEMDVARATAERALALRIELHGAESAEAARSELTLGWTLANQGDFAQARARLEHAIATLERIEGPESLVAAEAREPLMELTFAAQGPAATLPIVERRLTTYRSVFAAPDERTGRALSDLGVVLGELERFPAAEAALRESLAILQATVSPDDPRLAYPYNNLAAILLATARPSDALDAAERAVAIRTRSLGATHPETGQSRGQHTQALLALGRLAEAENAARSLFADLEGRDPFAATLALATLGQVELAMHRSAEAFATFEKALAARRELLPEQHPLVLMARLDRAGALIEVGRESLAAAEVEALQRELEKRPELSSLSKRAQALRARIAR